MVFLVLTIISFVTNATVWELFLNAVMENFWLVAEKGVLIPEFKG